MHHGNTRARNASEYIKVTEWLVADMGRMNFPVITFCSENDTMCDPDGSRMLIDRSKVSGVQRCLCSLIAVPPMYSIDA